LNSSNITKRTDELQSKMPETTSVYRMPYSPPFGNFATITLKYFWPPLLFAAYYYLTSSNQIYSDLLWSVEAPAGRLITFGLFGSYFLLLLCFIKKEFVLRQSGITLPFVYFWNSFGRLNWSWKKLDSVCFSRSSPQLPTADQVVLTFLDTTFNRTVDIHIKLKEIHQLELKKLVYTIVTNAPHAVFEPALDSVALEFPTVSGIKHLNFHSFTSMWDEEFSTRYSPTLFVPLAPEHELQNGAIRISELVACGGSAAVYAAKDIRGNQIIVKEAVIPKNASEALKEKAIEMFKREAMFLSQLDHPNIAKVLDHFVENEHHYEVLEFIDGLDLRRFVKERGPQPEDFVLNWAEQICELVVYLHSQDPPIIHRDLTPDNLVLRVDGQLVLIDFGAANAFVGIATGTMVGKQAYMPPEQLRGKSLPQSDIYSLGGTLYFLLMGRDPIPLEVSQIDDRSKVSFEMNRLLSLCTAFEVSDRYQTAVGLLHEIRKIRSQRRDSIVLMPTDQPSDPPFV